MFKGPEKYIFPGKNHITAGLHLILRLAVGARVYIDKNLDISDGLVNGANDIISTIRINEDHRSDGIKMVENEMDELENLQDPHIHLPFIQRMYQLHQQHLHSQWVVSLLL